MKDLVQFVMAGITVGAIYGLIALGFAIIYKASDVINFSQGEFVMIGGMATVNFIALGVPLLLAILLAVLCAAIVGVIVEKVALEPAIGSGVTALIIITIGVSIFLRGVVQIIWGKNFHTIPALSGKDPIYILSAPIEPQVFWIIGVSLTLVLLLWLFFNHSKLGRAFRAVSDNMTAARIVGIEPKWILTLSFVLSAVAGAIGGILIAPLTLTSYDVGVMLGLKGFSAAILGGLGSPIGAFVGGLLLGLTETFVAGYLSSAYKDAVAIVIILLVIFFRPNGLFGGLVRSRV